MEPTCLAHRSAPFGKPLNRPGTPTAFLGRLPATSQAPLLCNSRQLPAANAVKATDVPYTIGGPRPWPAVQARTFVLACPAVADRRKIAARNKPHSLRSQPPTFMPVPPSWLHRHRLEHQPRRLIHNSMTFPTEPHIDMCQSGDRATARPSETNDAAVNRSASEEAVATTSASACAESSPRDMAS